ncbi:MAG: helix-turn-helix domain-containing protein [Terriglobales bacterium]
MPSFGEKLKLEREKRKISLDQISSTTKIGTRMLQALEEDRFGQLPGGIFNKGFVRAYARVVGLDEDQVVADYLQASGEAPAPKPEMAIREGGARDAASRDAAREEGNRISRLEAISDEPSRPLPWGVFAIILLIVALLLSLWSRQRREQERTATRPVAARTLRAAGESAPQSASVSESGAGAATETPASSSSLLAGTAARSAAENSSGAPAPGEFLVLIHAREESWVSVTVDGKFAGSELLEAGSERTFHARRDVSIKAGNAGALDFHLDGKKLDVGGSYGEVKSVTIGHAGLIPNPSSPPANP